MTGYIYQTDLWCEDCGQAIRNDIDKAGHGPADPDDEYSYDSGEYPKKCDVSSEADIPQHCGAGAECLNAEQVADGWKIGQWLENSLTTEGIAYVRQSIIDEPDNPVCHLWADYYADEIGSLCPHCGRPIDEE